MWLLAIPKAESSSSVREWTGSELGGAANHKAILPSSGFLGELQDSVPMPEDAFCADTAEHLGFG